MGSKYTEIPSNGHHLDGDEGFDDGFEVVVSKRTVKLQQQAQIRQSRRSYGYGRNYSQYHHKPYRDSDRRGANNYDPPALVNKPEGSVCSESSLTTNSGKSSRDDEGNTESGSVQSPAESQHDGETSSSVPEEFEIIEPKFIEAPPPAVNPWKIQTASAVLSKKTPSVLPSSLTTQTQTLTLSLSPTKPKSNVQPNSSSNAQIIPKSGESSLSPPPALVTKSKRNEERGINAAKNEKNLTNGTSGTNSAPKNEKNMTNGSSAVKNEKNMTNGSSGVKNDKILTNGTKSSNGSMSDSGSSSMSSTESKDSKEGKDSKEVKENKETMTMAPPPAAWTRLRTKVPETTQQIQRSSAEDWPALDESLPLKSPSLLPPLKEPLRMPTSSSAPITDSSVSPPGESTTDSGNEEISRIMGPPLPLPTPVLGTEKWPSISGNTTGSGESGNLHGRTKGGGGGGVRTSSGDGLSSSEVNDMSGRGCTGDDATTPELKKKRKNKKTSKKPKWVPLPITEPEEEYHRNSMKPPKRKRTYEKMTNQNYRNGDTNNGGAPGGYYDGSSDCGNGGGSSGHGGTNEISHSRSKSNGNSHYTHHSKSDSQHRGRSNGSKSGGRRFNSNYHNNYNNYNNGYGKYYKGGGRTKGGVGGGSEGKEGEGEFNGEEYGGEYGLYPMDYYVPYFGPPHVANYPLYIMDESVLLPLIKSQVEYYFSEENLERDFYMRRKMDPEGWIPIRLISTFYRLQSMTQDYSLILKALTPSSVIEVRAEEGREGEEAARPLVEPTKWPIPDYSPTELQLLESNGGMMDGREMIFAESGVVGVNNPGTLRGLATNVLNPNVPEFVPLLLRRGDRDGGEDEEGNGMCMGEESYDADTEVVDGEPELNTLELNDSFSKCELSDLESESKGMYVTPVTDTNGYFAQGNVGKTKCKHRKSHRVTPSLRIEPGVEETCPSTDATTTLKESLLTSTSSINIEENNGEIMELETSSCCSVSNSTTTTKQSSSSLTPPHLPLSSSNSTSNESSASPDNLSLTSLPQQSMFHTTAIEASLS